MVLGKSNGIEENDNEVEVEVKLVALYFAFLGSKSQSIDQRHDERTMCHRDGQFMACNTSCQFVDRRKHLSLLTSRRSICDVD